MTIGPAAHHLLRLAGALLAAVAMRAEDLVPITYEANVAMQARDGVTLRADIYRPKEDGRYPVLLLRAPYDKRIYITEAIAGAQRGYVYVVQDTRGRFGSDGDWYPFRHEANDTYDAVEWAAALPCANGKVGLTGISYVAVPGLLGAIAAPPHLVAIYPGITASDYHDNWIYQGGALMQAFAQGWSQYFSQAEAMRRLAKVQPPAWTDALRIPPVTHPPVEAFSTTDLSPYYRDWISHPAEDAYWQAWSIERNYGRIKVPALHWGAWYDLFMPGAIRLYQGLKEHGGSPEARAGQRLVITPGGHAGVTQKIGSVDFGKESVFDFWSYGMRWFDWVLKGLDNGVAREKPVRLFVMGTNVWRDEDDWPLARAKAMRYHLRSGGHANTLKGDGTLSLEPPGAEPADTCVYDPLDPTPTRGGVLAVPTGITAGPQDQRPVEERADVLVYTAPPFAEDTEVTGMVTLELFARSSAVDTDFTGKLVDVAPDGTALNLCEGILRARYRNSLEQPELLHPGETYRLRIEVGATANVFLMGHSLRLEVASANYPRYSRNSNNGEQPETATAWAKASNTILHDRDHPSALIVPVIPQSSP